MLKKITVVLITFVASVALVAQAEDLPTKDPTQAEGPWTHHYYTVQDGTKLHYVEKRRRIWLKNQKSCKA